MGEGGGEGCIKALVQLGVFAGMVCLVLYGSIALANEPRDDLLAVCPNQDIWVWLIVMVVISGVQLLGGGSGAAGGGGGDADRKRCAHMILLGVSLGSCIGLVAWGSELLFATCPLENLRDSHVWHMAYIYWMLNVIVLGLVAVGSVFVVLWLYCRRDSGDVCRV
jgi:hypothetical protein